MVWFGNSQLGTAHGMGEFTQEDRDRLDGQVELLLERQSGQSFTNMIWYVAIFAGLSRIVWEIIRRD